MLVDTLNLNRENLVEISISIQLDKVCVMSPGISEITDLGSLNSTKIVLLVYLEDGN